MYVIHQRFKQFNRYVQKGFVPRSKKRLIGNNTVIMGVLWRVLRIHFGV